MRLAAALCLLLPAIPVASPIVFDGYEAYYATLSDRLFEAKTAVELEAYSLEGSESAHFRWAGIAQGQRHVVEIRKGALSIDGHVLRLRSARVFPSETATDEDLGRGSVAYVATGWMCVENVPASASGTAVRHKSVYLVRLGQAKLQAWKLPSLFASCLGIRRRDGQVRFDKVEYRYSEGHDTPAGVVFKDYEIRSDKTFASTGLERVASFLEPENVYRFSLDVR